MRRTFPKFYHMLRRLQGEDFDSYMAYTWPVHIEVRRLFRGRRIERAARAIYAAGDAAGLRAALHALDLVWADDGDRLASSMRSRRTKIIAAFDGAWPYWDSSRGTSTFPV